jgi:hypothetical protein
VFFELLTVLIIAGFANALRNDLEQKAGDKYQEFQKRVEKYEKEIEVANQKLKQELDGFNKSISIEHLFHVHHESHLISQEAYKALEDVRIVQQEFKNTAKAAVIELDRLKHRRQELYDMKIHNEIQPVKKEIGDLYAFLDALRKQQNEIRLKAENFKSKVQTLNHRTHDFKLRIRDHSEGGKKWYLKQEEKKNKDRDKDKD